MHEESTRGAPRLTREELYERVWAEPMATLAPQLGLSDVGLKKTCLRMRVPTPPRGHWAKRAAGQRVKRTPLPKLPASVTPDLLAVTFAQPPRPTPEPRADEVGPVGDQRRHEARPEHRVTVADVLRDPHPLVAASVHLLRDAKADGEHRLVPRGRKCLALHVTLPTVDRALRLYDALIKALDARGYPVAVVDEAPGNAPGTVVPAPVTLVRIGQDPVQVTLDERVDRVAAASSPSSAPRGPRGAPVPAIAAPGVEYVPTGRLTFRLMHSSLNVRRSWGDGSTQRLEDVLNDVIVGLVAASEALRAQREAREARQREWEAQEARRREAVRRQQEEAGRVRALDASMRRWRKARAVREYAAAMRAAAEAATLPDDAPVWGWLQWAEGYADRLDPAHGVPVIPADPQPHTYGISGGYGTGWGGQPEDARPIW